MTIEVIIRHKESDTELGRIEIENVMDSHDPDYGNYAVRFGVEKIKSVGVHTRTMLNFPRTKYNVLGLVLQALNTLDPVDLELEGDLDDGLPERGRLGWHFKGH